MRRFISYMTRSKYSFFEMLMLAVMLQWPFWWFLGGAFLVFIVNGMIQSWLKERGRLS